MLFTTFHLRRSKVPALLKMFTLVFLLLLLSEAGPVDRPRNMSSVFERISDNESERLEKRDSENNGGDRERFRNHPLDEGESSRRPQPFIEDDDTYNHAVTTDADATSDSLVLMSIKFHGNSRVSSVETMTYSNRQTDAVSMDRRYRDQAEDIDEEQNLLNTTHRGTRSAMRKDDRDGIENGERKKSELDSIIDTNYRSRTDNVNVHPRFNPWIFETRIDDELYISVGRLSASKSEIEDYTARFKSQDRIRSVEFNLMDANYRYHPDGPYNVYRRPKYIPELFDTEDDLGHSPEPPARICHFLWAYDKTWIELVSVCIPDWKDEAVARLCAEDVGHVPANTIDILSLPVQDERGVVYRNIFCAECNRAWKAKSWDVSLQCEGASSIYFIDGDIGLSLMPQFAASSNCRQTMLPIQPLNVQKCHEVNRRSAYGGKSHRQHPVKTETYPVSFSVLMNFGFDGRTHILFSSSSHQVGTAPINLCQKPNQIWDGTNSQCRTIVCYEGYYLVNNGCVKDSTIISSTDGDLPSVQTLTSFPDVAVISLIVNSSGNSLLQRMSPEIKGIMIAGMASLLNISSERIQNFTVEEVTGSNPGPQVAIRPFNHDKDFPSEEGGYQHDADLQGEFSFTGSTNVIAEDTVRDGHTGSSSSDTPKTHSSIRNQNLKQFPRPRRSTEQNSPGLHLKKRYSKEETTVLPRFHQHGYELTISPSRHHKKNSSTKHNTTTSISTYRITFLLLPARSSTLHESTVSSVRAKIDRLFQQKKLTLSLNGTDVTVLDMINADRPSIKNETFCSTGKMQFYFADELQLIEAVDKSETTTIAHIFVKSTNSIYGPGKFDLTLWMSGNVGISANLTDFMGYAFVCVMPRIVHSGCTRYEFEQKDYSQLKNMSIFLNNRLYNMTEYEYRDESSGTIEICVPDSDLHPAKIGATYLVVHGCVEGFEKFIMASAYMTAVLGRISIVALAIVFVTYCLLPQLRNLPGVNTMNLTLSLLIAESVFIVGEESVDMPWVCSLVSILLHYFFLASFFWMNVMSFDVFRTFANTTCALPHIRQKSKHLLKYVLYSWGSPAIIVAICVILDFTKLIPGVDIGYGRHHSEAVDEQIAMVNDSNHTNQTVTADTASLGCWIQNPVATLAAFGAPIVLILLINIYLFVKTILCIRKMAKFTSDNTRRSTMNRHNGRNDVILYVRMSTVMGFTWLFGLASSMISATTTTSSDTICYTEHIIGLLFVIFNCSQGLFIFFAFVTKKRVFFLYKSLWMATKQKIVRRQRNRQRYLSNSGSQTSTASTTTVSTICSVSTSGLSVEKTSNIGH